MFRMMLIASKKKDITKKWLTQGFPTLSHWFNIMHDTFVMEELTFALIPRTNKYKECWKGWTEFYKP